MNRARWEKKKKKKRKKISRSPLDRWTVSSSINNNNNNKVIKTSDRIAWRKGERD